MATCSRLSGECWQWAKVYLDDCVCGTRDRVSFGLGLVSVLSWAVAEIPQIMTNYKNKSVEGLSLGFLITWIVGDLFNLSGCILEPATLPMQYYMAVLYAITTFILTAQTVYYGHSYPDVRNKDLVQEPLLGTYVTTQSTSRHRELISPWSLKSLLCSVSALMFIGLFNSNVSKFKVNQGFMIHIGRKLLQSNSSGSEGGSRVGTFLGWAMAIIYMGGRLPQIYLIIRRGNVEGLSPFMFIFALVGNFTYVASILVRSLDWSIIEPNLPWLVDAGGCALLDAFIVIQIIYFSKWAGREAAVEHESPWEFC
ncbi:vacuolar-sorting receptor 7 [Hibiscus syriacus]|uniref:Vacuolar-sorting receptor 7 n=1 Tax=Hibiscus syriacus TaxID=106335 RepID=A0A6A3C3U1_HIBSY|nr:lysosomal amino acid transporter 1-like [Hibiscus syriacus]KAE8723454.1 vacuolar-sorting receptor 7 [Hibiscus syriacus]